MWNWFTILITILITHDFRTTKKPSKYWAFTAGDEGLEPLYRFLYRRNSFHVHAKHRINTGFFTFSIVPRTKHLHHYTTRCNTKCNTKMIQYSLPDCQSGGIFLLNQRLKCIISCDTIHGKSVVCLILSYCFFASSSKVSINAITVVSF